MNLPGAHPLASLFELCVPFEGRERLLRLRVPATRLVYPMILMPDQRTPERLGMILPMEFADMIQTVDDRPATLADGDALALDPRTASALAARQKNLIESVTEHGRAYMQCPACRDWEADLTLTALTLLLQTAPWPIFEGPFLALPSLALLLAHGCRPDGLPRTSRVRYEPPSAVLDGEPHRGAGVLGDLDEDPRRARELETWAQWAPLGEARPPEREDWNSGVPGFRAILRLCIALDDGVAAPNATSPEAIEEMPVSDFFFLDQLYYLTHNVSIAVEQAALTCERCATRFLPVR